MNIKIKKQLFILAIFTVTFFVPRFEHPSATTEQSMVLGASTSLAEETAKEAETVEKRIYQKGDEKAPYFSSRSILVFDTESETILYSKSSDLKLPIASLTKLMTAVVVSEDPKFNEPITITAKDQLSVTPNLRLRVGDQIMPADLIKAMLVGSANDAALTLANHFPSKDEFIKRMNEKALALGMGQTKFSTPIGFDSPNNYSTAADLSVLVRYALTVLPIDQIWQSKSYSFTSAKGQNYTIRNSNDLVFTNPNVRSIKTGFTNLARENMVTEIDDGNGHSFIAIVLGANDRNKETLRLAKYIQDNFAWE